MLRPLLLSTLLSFFTLCLCQSGRDSLRNLIRLKSAFANAADESDYENEFGNSEERPSFVNIMRDLLREKNMDEKDINDVLRNMHARTAIHIYKKSPWLYRPSGHIPIQTRLASFGSKLVPNKFASDPTGNLLRYGWLVGYFQHTLAEWMRCKFDYPQCSSKNRSRKGHRIKLYTIANITIKYKIVHQFRMFQPVEWPIIIIIVTSNTCDRQSVLILSL